MSKNANGIEQKDDCFRNRNLLNSEDYDIFVVKSHICALYLIASIVAKPCGKSKLHVITVSLGFYAKNVHLCVNLCLK